MTVTVLVSVGPGCERVTVLVVVYRTSVPLTVVVITAVIVIVPGTDWVIVWVVVVPVLVVVLVNVVVEEVTNPPPLSATTPTASAPKERTRTTSERMLFLTISSVFRDYTKWCDS